MARGVGKVWNADDDMIREGRRLLRQGGPAALSFRNIARGLGCSPSVFYNYVPNVEALRYSIGREVLVELRTAMRLPLVERRVLPVPRQLVFMAHAYRAFWRGEPASLNFVLRREATYPSLYEQDYVDRIWPELTSALGSMRGLLWWSRLHGIVHLEIARALEAETAEQLWVLTVRDLESAAAAAHEIAAAARPPAGAPWARPAVSPLPPASR
jgi:AcrR family transcriptional regulator